MSQTIYHIADPNQWEQAQSSRLYVHPSLHSEGFIHCSTAEQLEETANLYFSESDKIIILHINRDALEADLVFEKASRGGEFPHIYGPLNLTAVKASNVVKKKGKRFSISIKD